MARRAARNRARRRPRALLIDAMGTLVTLQAPAPRLRRELAVRFGIDICEREAAAALAAEIAFYRAHMGEGRDDQTLRALRLRCARALAAALPALRDTDDEQVLAALLASLRFVAFEDARAALLAVRARGVRVVAVSNWDVSVLDMLERVGLAPLLHGAVCSAVIGAAKPTPAIFAHALSEAGAAPSDALHVGDSVAEDVAGARAAGIEPVLLDRSGSGERVEGVRTIFGLDELDWPPVRPRVAGP
ncbi:MAG TPA: HAD family hydrolase [Solirubrobacteraceae bacterium]|nr:HAD family hydrolase [Solirubrobacteraceae bacterium]